MKIVKTFIYVFFRITIQKVKLVKQTEKNILSRDNVDLFALRLLFAVELAMIMDRLYGGVCYAGIDTDPELKYPKGAGRVAFSNQQSYIAAISARFVQLQHGEIDKRVCGKKCDLVSHFFTICCVPTRVLLVSVI